MSVTVWNCHFRHWDGVGGPSVKIGSSAKLCVLIFKASLFVFPGESICQSIFICQVWCSGIQGMYSQFRGGSVCQSVFFCQVLCTGIQGIYAQLTLVVLWPKYVCLPSVVYWSSKYLCSICGRSHLPKYVSLPSVVYWYSRHLCSIHVGGPLAKVGLWTQNVNQNIPQ